MLFLKTEFMKKHYYILTALCMMFSSCDTITTSKHFNSSHVESGQVYFTTYQGTCILPGDYVFDTGASVSSFSECDSAFSTARKTTHRLRLSDISGTSVTIPYYYLKEKKFDDIVIHNLYMGKSNSNDFRWGVIGMDVIEKMNWLINFKDSTISCFSKDSAFTIPTENFMLLEYHNKFAPKISLIINNTRVDSILFDTGSGAGLSLSKEQIKKIGNNAVTDTLKEINKGLFTKEHYDTVSVYVYDTLIINSASVYNATIGEITNQKMGSGIGMGFFRAFDNLFIDTKNQVFYLYN